MRARKRAWIAGCFVAIMGAIAMSEPARADIGLPMIFLTLPSLAIALVPIVCVEGVILAKHLVLRFRSVLWPSTLANLVSTIIGVPITWGILLVLELLTGGGTGAHLPWSVQRILYVTFWAPWLPPAESDLYWMVPVATLSLMVPFCVASWLLESEVLWRTLLRSDAVVAQGLHPRVRKAALWANLASYSGLAAIVIGALIIGVIRHHAF